MDKIQINQKFFEIEDIRKKSEHVLQITFSNEIPESCAGDISVYTSGGDLCSNFNGYDTIYKNDGKTVYLSNDGSIYPSTGTGMPKGA